MKRNLFFSIIILFWIVGCDSEVNEQANVSFSANEILSDSGSANAETVIPDRDISLENEDVSAPIANDLILLDG